MEFLEIKNMLEDISNTDRLIDAKLVEVGELRRRLTDIKSPSFGDRVQTTKDPDKFTDTIAKITEMEAEINFEVDKLIDTKNVCRQLVESLESNFYKVVLYKLYFEGKTLREVSETLRKSIRQIARIRNNAIVQIAEISKCP